MNKLEQKGGNNEFANELFGSKIQYGGSHTVVPESLPRTYSFLFMSLIYYIIDPTSVQMFEDFENVVNQCIKNSIDIMGIELPFENFNGFITYLKHILMTNNIKTLDDIEKLRDGDHHIPGDTQEKVTNYNTDQFINIIISCIAAMLVEQHEGKKFEYVR